MTDVVMYKTKVCPYCVMTGMLLKKKGVSWREVDVTFDVELRQEMEERSGRRTVPRSSSTTSASAATTTSPGSTAPASSTSCSGLTEARAGHARAGQ